MAKVCIVCRKEIAEGNPIRDDAIIRFIRKLKQKTGTIQNNVLMVCDADLEAYKKKRQNFEKMAVLHATAAVIAVAILFVAPLILGAPFSIVNLFFALILGIMIAALAILSYTPALETREWAGAKPGLAERLTPPQPEAKRRESPEEIARRLSPKPAPKPARKPERKPARRK
ncbi:MAG: hypothetical protein QXH30_02700 [Candidatus Bilamarchaeaceae archaeon]